MKEIGKMSVVAIVFLIIGHFSSVGKQHEDQIKELKDDLTRTWKLLGIERVKDCKNLMLKSSKTNGPESLLFDSSFQCEDEDGWAYSTGGSGSALGDYTYWEKAEKKTSWLETENFSIGWEQNRTNFDNNGLTGSRVSHGPYILWDVSSTIKSFRKNL